MDHWTAPCPMDGRLSVSAGALHIIGSATKLRAVSSAHAHITHARPRLVSTPVPDSRALPRPRRGGGLQGRAQIPNLVAETCSPPRPVMRPTLVTQDPYTSTCHLDTCGDTRQRLTRFCGICSGMRSSNVLFAGFGGIVLERENIREQETSGLFEEQLQSSACVRLVASR